LNGESARIDFSPIIGRRRLIRPTSEHEKSEKICELVLWEKSESELSAKEIDYLLRHGISPEALLETNACIISGYALVFETHTKHCKSPQGQIWIAYKYSGGAKIYCPNPKKFWYVGAPPKNYLFGNPFSKRDVEGEKIVFLVGGEKDVLCLKSRGIEAMCLN